MKTKNLLTGVALSAMFAACTQDVELNEAIAKNDYSDVPMVEADFSVNTDAESRLATKFTLEKDDIIGFVWDGDADPADGKAHANYPLYVIEDGKGNLKGESMYYVGKYFAYVPYSELKKKDFIPFSIEGQELSTTLADYAKHKIMITPTMTELVELGEDDELETGQQEAGRKKNYPLNLADLTNTAQIKLNFENAEALADLKVTKVSLDLIGGTSGTASTLTLGFNFDATGYEDVEKWNENEPADFYDNFVSGNRKTGALTLENEEGLAVTDGNLTTYAVVLPAKTTQFAELNVTVETNYGKIVANDVKVIAQGKTEADAKAVSASTALFTEFGTTGTIVAKLDVEDIEVGEQKAATQAELNTILNKLVASEYSEAVTIKLQPATAATTKPFTLTDFTLPEGLEAIVNLTAGDKTDGTIVFAGNTVISKQLVVTSKSKVTGTMTVNYIKDLVTLNAAEITVDNGATLINNGQILAPIVTKAATTGNNAKPFGKYISNDDNAAIIGAGSLTNNGEAQWIAGTVPTSFEGRLSGNQFYAIATSMKEINNIGYHNVKNVRLYDVTLSNEYQTWDQTYINSVWEVQFYGNCNFNLTTTKGDESPCSVKFENASIIVKENATLTITSDIKDNTILLPNGHFVVEKNAKLNVSNTNTNTSVNNYGSVSLVDAINITEVNPKHEGSTWSSVTNQ